MPGLETDGPLFDASKQNITPEIRAAAKRAAAYALFRLRARTPVATGELRSKWQVDLRGDGLKMSNAAEHATYVEFGTRYMRARPMLQPTRPEAMDVFKYELGRAVGRKLAADQIGGVQNQLPSAREGRRDDALYNALTRGGPASLGRRGFRGAKIKPLSYSKDIKRYERRYGKAKPLYPGKLQSKLNDRIKAL